jgi:hypothetical protein
LKVYTDASQLPRVAEAARLPSFNLPGVSVPENNYASAETVAKRLQKPVSEENALPSVHATGSRKPAQTDAAALEICRPADELRAGFPLKDVAPNGNSEVSELAPAGATYDTAPVTLAGVVLGVKRSDGVASSRVERLSQVAHPVAFRHEKTAEVASSGFPKMERAKRLELSTSTLARWCSTN